MCKPTFTALYVLEEKPPKSIPMIEQVTTTTTTTTSTTTTTTTNVYCELQCAGLYCEKFNAVVEVTRSLP